MHDKGLPIVFFDRITDEINTHKVTANNYPATFQIIEHLIHLGFLQITHITNSLSLSITNERLKGYRDALEKHNIPCNESLVKYCNHGGIILDEIKESIDELFKAKAKPDAIRCK